ncbi:MAG: N-acetylglucosamine kinase [Bacteroidota bacterium]
MILIADNGGTSCSWRLINPEGEVSQFKTFGFNPYHQDKQDLEQQITPILAELRSDVEYLYYYSTGCGAESNRVLIRNVLGKSFKKASIEVEDDMLAVARALCGTEPGIACILGTGANSCYYNGHLIAEQVTSLGYVLGDEGGGAYLGKKLLADFLRSDMDEHVAKRFKKRFDISRDEVLDRVYNQEAPGRYMASYTKFLLQNIKESYCYRLVYESFCKFFEKNVLKYTKANNVSVHFSGSVAFYFTNVLRQAASDKGIVLKNVIESPIAGLTLYHNSQHFK